MIYTYGIELSELKKIPTLDPEAIGPRSTPVSTRDLIRWMEDGAGFLNGALRKSSIEPNEDLAPETHQRNKAAVIAYVTYQALEAMGVTGPTFDNAKKRWDESYGEASNRPQQMGASYKDPTTTNLDTPVRVDWDFGGFTKDNW